MKRPLTIVTIMLLTILILYACSSTIRAANTSFVTITIGGNNQKATLHAEGATPWARFKYFLADAKLMPEAQAYIPSVVQVLIVTVSAPDMTTIVAVDDVSNKTSTSITLEVPNGNGRTFTVEGIRGTDSQTYYQGTATADLGGADVTLPIIMNFMGTGIYVDPNLDPLTADQPLCGTQANPCATITYVLNSRPSTTDNDVILALAGTYKPGTIAAQESFPLTLKPGMVLLCMGAGFSSVIDVSTAFATAIWGNEGAAVDNCMIKVGVDSSGIDDQATRTKINGAYIEISGSPSETSIVGVLLSNDSLLLESTVTGSAASGSVFGVQVQGGKPAIINSTISNLPIGIDLTPSAGDAVITNTNVIGIPGISTGINISTSEKPTINNTTITGHSTGVAINAGSADIVSSTLEQNGTGIMISESFSGVSPRITNSVIRLNDTGISMSFFAYPGSPRVNSSQLYCNVFTDVFVYSNINVIDLTGNAWDNAPPVVLSNSSEQCTGSGDDVCWGGTLPNTGGYRAPVGVTCPVY